MVQVTLQLGPSFALQDKTTLSQGTGQSLNAPQTTELKVLQKIN